MSNKTAAGLVEYCRLQLGKPYWYGTFGQRPTEALLVRKSQQWPAFWGHGRVERARREHIGRYDRVHDCSGMIKGYLWSDTPACPPRYNAAQDLSANMFRSRSNVQPIASMPDIPGLGVFFNGHVGIYIGNGQVIEARGAEHGVVQTALRNRPWTTWGRLPWIDYGTQQSAVPAIPQRIIDDIAREVMRGAWGNGADRVRRLTAAGHDAAAVQQRVNEILRGDVCFDAIAREVILGRWGNGAERVRLLTVAGHDPRAVQARVNEILRGGA